MRLPNWSKIVWWGLVTSSTTGFLYQRYSDLVAGRAAPADVIVFLVWLALVLAPIFDEITIPGLKFKQQIESLKKEITQVRSELHSTADARASLSQQINFPLPPSDAQLPDLERVAKAAAAEALREYGTRVPPPPPDVGIPPDVQFLFATRYNLEREIYRIAYARGVSPFGPRVISPMQMIRAIASAQLISPQLERSIREVYAVCSAAVHAQDVTPAKIAFVRDVADDLLNALRAID